MKLIGRIIRLIFPRRQSEIEVVKPEEVADLATHVQRCTARVIVTFDQLYALRRITTFLVLLIVVTMDWDRATVVNIVIDILKKLL